MRYVIPSRRREPHQVRQPGTAVAAAPLPESDAGRPRTTAAGIFARFGRYVRPYALVLTAGALLGLVTISLGVAQPWPLKVVVDDVLRAKGGNARGLIPSLIPAARSPRTLLAIAVGSLVALVVVGAAADYWSTWLLAKAGQRIGNDLRETVFAHLQRLSLRYHAEHPVGDLSARVTEDVDQAQDMLVQVLTVLVPNAALIIAMLTVMLVVDPVFTGVSLAIAPLLALAVFRATRIMKEASRRARRRGGEVAAVATETLSAIQLVQGFTLEDDTQARFSDLSRASMFAGLEAARQQARLSPLTDVAASVSVAILLWFGAGRVLSHRLSLGVLLVFVAYLQALYKPVKYLSKAMWVISKGVASAERISLILDELPDVADHPHARTLAKVEGRVDIEGVTFSYGREPVLRDVSLSLAPGEVAAIVGPTGAGKSTLVSLIPRFFDPQAGVVRVDGVDLRDVSVRSLRSRVALVLQDSVLFRGTLWSNIACGRADCGDDDVRRAVKLALVDEFADRLPDGLDTIIGERGVNLSGGQRQRVAIARAFVRDAPILILDEPTSALDASSEHLVVEALQNLMQGRTTVVIAHRLSTIRGAGRILVLEQGRIVEEGTHDELMATSGTYARLSRLQENGSEPPGAPAPSMPVTPAVPLVRSMPFWRATWKGTR